MEAYRNALQLHRDLCCKNQCFWALMVLAFLWTSTPTVSWAQAANYAQQGEPEDEGLALLQTEPHDIIRFTEKSGGGWAKVRLLGVAWPKDADRSQR
jgi:hypothetical protein